MLKGSSQFLEKFYAQPLKAFLETSVPTGKMGIFFEHN